MGCGEALRLAGRYLLRAVRDRDDTEAREGMAWAASLAGMAFGNAGVHLPHAMSYAVSGLVRDFRMPGYPEEEPLVPHGVSVMVNAPAVVRHFAGTNPARHLEAAAWLGAEVAGARPDDAGELLAAHLVGMMRSAGIPNGVSGVGYMEDDLPALAAGTVAQARLLANAPRAMTEEDLPALFRSALAYW